MEKKIMSWIGHRFESSTVRTPEYQSFERAMRANLRKQCKENGLELVSFLPMHFQFSAVVKGVESGKYAYISISDVRFFQDEWVKHTLYRIMKHDHDWSGGSNQYCAWENVGANARKLCA